MSDLGVRSGMDPARWHGAFDCAGVCERKRLPAVEFSANMQAKKRRDPAAIVRCKKCTAEAAANERALAAETAKLRVASDPSDANAGARPGDADPTASHACAACGESKPASAFSRAQLNNKGPGKQRCAACCAASEDAAASAAAASRDEKLAAAREASKRAEATNAPDKLAVFAREAALEAELVTGLKPQRVGGRGRGRGRGGRWSGGRSGGRG
jgi:hypothetical protein